MIDRRLTKWTFEQPWSLLFVAVFLLFTLVSLNDRVIRWLIATAAGPSS